MQINQLRSKRATQEGDHPTMNEIEARQGVFSMDTQSTEAQEVAWARLKLLGMDVVPYLAEAYPQFKKWQGRAALVFHATRYARVSESAFQLGIAALKDKATLVRYRACGLLAYSLNRDAIPFLEITASEVDAKTAGDAKAALLAIRHSNHHLFIDRSRTGQSFWVVNESDSSPDFKPQSWLGSVMSRIGRRRPTSAHE